MRQSRLMTILLGFLAVSQVACSKGQKQQCDMACIQFYQSLMRNNPETKSLATKSLNEILASNPSGGIPVTGSSPTLNDVLKNSGIDPKTVDQNAIRAHAASVAAALEADKHNPDSPFYEPPFSPQSTESASARTPASMDITAAPVEEATPYVSVGGSRSSGNAAR